MGSPSTSASEVNEPALPASASATMEATAATKRAMRLGIVLAANVMGGIPNVSLEVMCLVAVEVVERLRPMIREWSVIPMPRVIPVIDVTIKAAWAMEPGAGSYEDATVEPVRTVIAVWCAFVGSVVEIPVRARRRGADPDTNRNLCRGERDCREQCCR